MSPITPLSITPARQRTWPRLLTAVAFALLLTVGLVGPAPAEAATRAAGAEAVEVALDQVGTPYRWGGASPRGFDCSGLTSYAWREAGETIPRTSRLQASQLDRISRSQLRPGDLVFFNSPVSHVAMYVGNGKIVEAPRRGTTVRVTSLAGRKPVRYARP